MSTRPTAATAKRRAGGKPTPVRQPSTSEDDHEPPDIRGAAFRPQLRTLPTDDSQTEGEDLLSPNEEAKAPLDAFSRRMDPSVSWVYKPQTLVALTVVAGATGLLAFNSHVLPQRIKTNLGLFTGIGIFLGFCMLNFRDGPFRRPHPAFWRIILGTNLLYCMTLAYLSFQTKDHARALVALIDPALGRPLDERSYAENCGFTLANVWDGIDIFCLAHALGWFGKAVILRDYWFCWILSVMFEVMEYSLEHQLPNFAECWWDHWILDVLLCNWLGTIVGMKACEALKVTPFSWRGLRTKRFARIRDRTGRIAKQFAPYDWTSFEWQGTKRFKNYLAVIFLLAGFLASEVTVFYIKYLLWIPPEHPLVIARLMGIFLWALPGVREYYEYVSAPKQHVRLGSHAWLLGATIALEVLLSVKWSQGEFPEPAPQRVKLFWAVLSSGLVIYPALKFGPRWLKQRKLAGENSSK